MRQGGLLSVFPKVSISKLKSSALCLAAANQRDEDVGKNEINTFQTSKKSITQRLPPEKLGQQVAAGM